MAEKWEYMARIVYADVDSKETSVRYSLRERWPKWNPPKHAVECIIPILNLYGEEGWEVIHIEPVTDYSNDGEILSANGWTNAYFCVMKRRKE